MPETGMKLHTGHEAVTLPLIKIARTYIIL